MTLRQGSASWDWLRGTEFSVPGSVANLGGGFDTLGVAVQVYLRVRIVDVVPDEGTRLAVIRSTPAVKGGNALERAFTTAARRTGRRTPTVSVEVISEIPMAAGLGSSAAATVAGLRVFEAVSGPLSEGALLGAATEVEGHADNAAPALFGGLTSVLERAGADPLALRWEWPDDLRLIVATPSRGLATATARAALPDSLSRRDAVFNLQRVLAFVRAIESHRFDLLREAMQDRWHQPARAALVPLLGDLLALDDPAVLGVCLSGAGPSVAVLATDDVERLGILLDRRYQQAGCPVVIRTLGVHHSSETVALAAAGASAHGRTA